MPAKTSVLLMFIADWCPYNNDELLIHAHIQSDTSGSVKQLPVLWRLYRYSQSRKTALDITPKQFIEKNPNVSLMHTNPRWLGTSTPGNDTFQFSQTQQEYGKYHQQSGALLPHEYAVTYGDPFYIYIQRSNSANYTFYFDKRLSNQSQSVIPTISINGLPLLGLTRDYIENVGSQCSWSPTDKYFALGVRDIRQQSAENCAGYAEVWVYDVQKLMFGGSAGSFPIHKINLRNRYCMYTSYGTYPTFTSDSTLVISMHKDGDTLQALYEVKLDGTMIRQLTFK
ncbi:MAG: hypothetical protein JNL32_03985 [Candidatus Kapabacteria bacterium]|nr:hypothetical protein [Candidatus Kapabacteria bacterium]